MTALDRLHALKVVHLDVTPADIRLVHGDDLELIDIRIVQDV